MSDRTPARPADAGPTERDRTGPLGPSRRAVLRTAGLVALAGGSATLAACSADAEVTAPGATPASSSAASSPTAAASSSAPASPSGSASASASASAASGPGVATSEVPVGGGVILDDADYVITQPTEGEFKAFSKICTHQGCPVSKITGEDIVCNCHNSKFSIKDGSVTSPPADQPLEEAEVTVQGGRVVVTA